MADYRQDPRSRSNHPQYGHPTSSHGDGYGQRDAAFSNIFGAAPPPGRSHTMTSSVPPPMMSHSEGRTHTMSSTSGGSMQRPPPQRPHRPADPGGGSGSGERGGYGDPRARLDTNGYSQSQRSVSAGQQVPSAQYLQQQQAARRPPPGAYPPQHAPRGDSVRADSLRGPAPQGFYNNASRSPAQGYYNQPGGQAGARLEFRPLPIASLASVPRPQMYQGATSQQSPANAFRQAQYNGSSARTTAQGRIVPERHEDRAMSMTGYPSYDRDAHQTPSGRVIPNRRAPGSSPDHGPTPSLTGGYPAGFQASGSQSGRTVSITSTTTVDVNGRTMSMASTIAPSIAPTERNEDGTLVHRYSGGASSMTGDRSVTVKIRMPLVYPALLSRVAETFRRKIVVGDRTKNELTYKNAFSGAEAVDVLSYIIRTTDRNLALLLGRALDAQKFFHDVTYEHRLRDSTYEMYQFRETLTDDEKPAVNGVFVLLSECYSPTCTPDQLCYSIACPRRLEQMSKLNLKGGAGLKQEGKAAVNDDDVDQTDEQKLWINSVPKEIADSIGDKEKKRQEVISEICYTERDFVKDLEYLRDFWIYPLKGKINGHSPIPLQRRERVVRTIFTNIIDPPSIHGVSSRFAKSLTERQQKTPVVQNIGDIFMEFVPQFEPFILYGAKQLEGKFEFENERSINKDFARFVDEVERRRESRKLELNGYLTKPTTRLARYPLLLENVLKYTEDGNSDKEDLPKVLVMIRDLLSRVNAESGKAENRFNLRRLHEQLKFRPNDKMDLKLTDEGRELVYKAQFKKSPTENADLTAFLFDHAVLLVKIKQVGKTEEIKAYRRPIPLELLSIKEMEEIIPSGAVKRTSSSLLPALRTTTDAKKGDGWPITFRHLGKNGYELTVYASNQAGRQKWLEFIDTAQQQLRARADFLNTTIISYGYFAGPNKVNCATPFDGGRKIIYGTDQGIFVSDRKTKEIPPKRVIDVQNVTQVDVLEEYSLLLVLSNKSLYSYQLDALNPNEPISSKRGKKIQSHCNFFKTGICLGRHLVCAVKSSALSTTIKVYEPNDAMSGAKKQRGLSKMFNAGQDELRPFKEFYIPTESSSVHFLKSKLCVACARGFEVVSLETLETQSLLDQADTSLDFVQRKEAVKPIHIERLNGEFLLNYSEFSFFVNRNGWRARPEWRLDWEGTPQAFALSYPWILAFEPNFIELRNIDNLAVHIVPHKNIRMLHSSTHEILFAYEDERGEDIIEAIDFWKSQKKSADM
ncbi:putative ROM1/2 protein [Sordaria macrospora k-hell]|uniref:Putative ROM1/2 protein n=1 Tax=Sordaria macrospora (strain ATCC MYA-333 / DSM 997 / K(L3346) / K-hell) TaxID=771870 RepID=F7VQJ9_SORMK|nr:LOW QUALITY PROTEIN: putative ROM1/2 protein [Sordaria macrospora k-hell]CCC07781.1 putative ROM1/2 protein [Sordaria macrospora k-hell]